MEILFFCKVFRFIVFIALLYCKSKRANKYEMRSWWLFLCKGLWGHSQIIMKIIRYNNEFVCSKGFTKLNLLFMSF